MEPRLARWESYHAFAGSSGAGQIGLQFVVMTLIAGMRRGPAAAAPRDENAVPLPAARNESPPPGAGPGG